MSRRRPAPAARGLRPSRVVVDEVVDLDDEVFTFLLWRWSITRARRLLAGRPAQPADISDAPTMLVRIDEEHLADVDLDEPIIVGWTPANGQTGERAPMPLDGWHRIARAQRAGRGELPALLLTPEESDRCLLAGPRTLAAGPIMKGLRRAAAAH